MGSTAGFGTEQGTERTLAFVLGSLVFALVVTAIVVAASWLIPYAGHGTMEFGPGIGGLGWVALAVVFVSVAPLLAILVYYLLRAEANPSARPHLAP